MKRALLLFGVVAAFHSVCLLEAKSQDKFVTADGHSIPLVRPWDTRPQVAGFFAKQMYNRTSLGDAPILSLFFGKILAGGTPLFCQFYSDCTNAQALADHGQVYLAKLFADHAASIRVAANDEVRTLSIAVEREARVPNLSGTSGFVNPVGQIQIKVNSAPGSTQ